MENLTRPIGLHIRLHSGLQDVIHTVQNTPMDVVQSFLITESNKYVSINSKIVRDFVRAKKEYDFLYFVHAAYWSGLTDSKSKMFLSLKKEVALAQDLKSDGIVIHVGASKKGRTISDKAQYVAESVNMLSESFGDVKLILENSPHAGRNFGGDVQDFAYVMEHIEKKENIGFCIDTTHAYVFGYDIAKQNHRQDFLQLLEETIGSYITLLHFNDSKDGCGSYIDKHEMPGEGMIGQTALQDIMKSSLFQNIPIIVELPGSCQKDDTEVISIVRSWDR